MTAWRQRSFSRLSAACVLSLVLFGPSDTLARSAGSAHDGPWNSEHIEQLPPEVRSAILRMCSVKPDAAHYFATYLENGRIIRLHFENFNCEGRQLYRHAASCLHEEFALSGSQYRLARSYYGRCDD
jgi:hypothetical protein